MKDDDAFARAMEATKKALADHKARQRQAVTHQKSFSLARKKDEDAKYQAKRTLRSQMDASRATEAQQRAVIAEGSKSDRTVRTKLWQATMASEHEMQRQKEKMRDRAKRDRWQLLQDLQQEHRNQGQAQHREQRQEWDADFHRQTQDRGHEQQRQREHLQQARAEIVNELRTRKQALHREQRDTFRQRTASGRDAAASMKHDATERIRTRSLNTQRQRQVQIGYSNFFQRKCHVDLTMTKQKQAELFAAEEERKKVLVSARTQQALEEQATLSMKRKQAFATAKLRAVRDKEAEAARRAESEERRATRDARRTAHLGRWTKDVIEIN